MKKLKIPYINMLPVFIIAVLIIKLIFTTKLSFGGIFAMLYDCVAYFVWGFIIAYLLNPALTFFEGLISSRKDSTAMRHAKRGGVIAFLYLLFVGVITIFVVAIIPTISAGVNDLLDNLPQYAEGVETWLQSFGGMLDPTLYGTVENWLESGLQFIYNWLRGLDFSSIGDAVGSAVSTSATAVIRVAFGMVVSVYFLYSKENLSKAAKKLLYALFSRERAESIIETGVKINKIFLNFIVSKLLQSMILFVVGLAVLVPIGIPLAPLISLFIAITNMIPYFGPYLGAIPSVILVFFYKPIMALWVILYAVGVQILDNVIISPKIMSDQMGISPLLVIAGVTIGGTVGGILGMFLGVPVVAVIKLVFYDPFIERRLRNKDIDI
ncbi:MAG: AI-2E family transporter [Clostridia bacterium]|nr:AI-2E family transporter [Clostridia bacterium]